MKKIANDARRAHALTRYQRNRFCLPGAAVLQCCSIFSFLVGANPVLAQDVAEPSSGPRRTSQPEAVADSTDRTQEQDIIVTGSRIGRSGFEAPTPLTAIPQAELEIKGVKNIATLIADIPALSPAQNSQTFSAVGAARLDLRNLGSNRTLVLLDGRRVAPTGPTGAIDVNVIPAALMSRVEIVTGGASAAYGSDAVAGVVNIFLNDSFDGLRADAQYGQSAHGGAREYSGSVTFGTGFANDRGRLILSGEAYRNDGESRQFSRDWGQEGWAIIANPLYVPGSNNGQPRQLVRPNTRFSQMTDGGVIVSPGPLQYLQFLPGGATAPFVRGANAGSTFMTGGDGAAFWPDANLLAKVERQSLFAHFAFELSDRVSLFAEAVYARNHQFVDVTPNYNNGDITITRDNAFLPAAIRTIMVANNMQSFRMGRTNLELGTNTGNTHGKVGIYTFGLKGKLGSSWSWDSHYQYSRSDFRIQVDDNRINANWVRAIDSVIDPATGKPVCRSALTDPNGAGKGCVPVNLFGPDTVTRSVVEYAGGVSISDSTITSNQVALNVRGEPFSIWGGPVSVAVGAEYRDVGIDGVSDPISEASGWRTLNQRATSGTTSVKEAYFETVVPLATDLPFAKLLELNAAIRRAEYSLSGGVTTWKVGLNYSPFDDLRLRGTLSRDIRAPNLAELFQPSRQQINALFDPFTGRTPNPRLITGGNPELKPEVARSLTFGAVYQPSWAPGLRTAVDVFDMKLEKAITTLAAQTLINQCFAGQTDLCPAIIRDTGGDIVEVRQIFFNADQLETRGVDLELAYDLPLDSVASQWDGDLRLRFLATYVDTFRTTSSGVTTDQAGTVNLPRWKWNLAAIYTNGPLTARLQGNYVAGGKLSNNFVEGVDIDDNDVTGRFYLNTSIQYELRPGFQIFGKVDNLLDQDPPVTPSGLISPQTASSPLYDVIGRFVAVGVRSKF